MRATSSSPAEGIRASLQDEARRLLAAAAAEGVPLRLLGGMGIRLLLGERLDPHFQREVEDLDFITTRRAGAAVERLLAAQGWAPVRHFNAVNGRARLLFGEPAGERRIDVFVGSFRMCHELPLAERLEVCEETLPAAELLLTKLQIVALNAKDRGDLYALLLGCAVAEDDGESRGALGGASLQQQARGGGPAAGERPAGPAINAPRIAALAAEDWGLYHTLELNFLRLREGLMDTGLDASHRERIEARIAALGAALQRAPKSRGWRLRARVGERRRWYEDPEEIAR